MTGSWLRLFAGATLTLSVAGHALADEAKITVFAAASLTNAMQDIAKEYKKEKNVEVVSSFASSSTLARQIEAGAPADLFISADQKWMDYAAEKKSIDTATRETLLGNSLVVVAPKSSTQGDITITTTHGKGTGRYIQSMSLGGKPLHSYRISHAQLIGGRHLTMQVGDR